MSPTGEVGVASRGAAAAIAAAHAPRGVAPQLADGSDSSRRQRLTTAEVTAAVIAAVKEARSSRFPWPSISESVTGDHAHEDSDDDDEADDAAE